MPRIRSLKPQFWDSPSTAKADLASRLLFMAMWNWADDAGRGTANLKELEAFAFPHDEIHTLPRMQSRGNSAPVWRNFAELFWETVQVYNVAVYVKDERKYYEISSFKDHQSKDFRPDSNRPAPSEGQKWDVASEYGLTPPPKPTQVAENPATPAENPRLAAELRPLDRDEDEDWDRDVVYDDTRAHPPEEPPADDDPGPPDVVNDAAPEHIDNASRPTKRTPSTSARWLIRQELGTVGNPYPRTTHDRLAIQAENLKREGHPDALIREAVKAWDKRTDALPEWLPTILGDLVKTQRATPGNNGRPAHKLRALAELAQETEAHEQAQLQLTNHHTPKELA